MSFSLGARNVARWVFFCLMVCRRSLSTTCKHRFKFDPFFLWWFSFSLFFTQFSSVANLCFLRCIRVVAAVLQLHTVSRDESDTIKKSPSKRHNHTIDFNCFCGHGLIHFGMSCSVWQTKSNYKQSNIN